MNLVSEEKPTAASERMICDALGLSRGSVRSERRRRVFYGPPAPRQTCRMASPQPRALSQPERQLVLRTLNCNTFSEQPPMQVYYRLLAFGVYLCSISTMHRILRAEQMNGEYLSLYVVMDLFSRYIVAWMLSTKENSGLSTQLMEEATARYGIEKDQLTIHQNRGVPMTAHCYLDVLSELGVTASHSRPRVSNDNPHSESLFKTAKYQPGYPGRFSSYSHAQQWTEEFVSWYNFDHHHSNLAGFTPHQVFTGEWVHMNTERQQALDKQHEQHRNRFVNGAPKSPAPPCIVEINPVIDEQGKVDRSGPVNFATLNRAKSNLTSA